MILQRRRGHRATSDDVLLAGFAASAHPQAQKILDLGSGKGTVALLLLRRLPLATAVGVEAFAQSHALAVRNAALNTLEDRYQPVLADLRTPDLLPNLTFDLICGAPPFMPVGSGTLPSDAQRAAGRFELRGGVADYAQAAAKHLAADGTVVLLMDGHGRARLETAFRQAGLQIHRLTGVLPRPGHAPTFWIAEGGAHPGPLEEATLSMRIGDEWSPAYSALRTALDLPKSS